MPQASDEDRNRMAQYFGDDGINDWPPTEFLIKAGFTERAGWWTKPSKDHVVTEKEYECLNFLCDEWDHAYDFRETLDAPSK